jgi:hypothetical protein
LTLTIGQASCLSMPTCQTRVEPSQRPGLPRVKNAFATLLLALPLHAAAMPCTGGMLACPKGLNGEGGCYKSAYEQCQAGAIFPAGMQYCNRGPNGPGGAFKPALQQCSGGVVFEAGMQYCPRGVKGPGGPYKPALSNCDQGYIGR